MDDKKQTAIFSIAYFFKKYLSTKTTSVLADKRAKKTVMIDGLPKGRFGKLPLLAIGNAKVVALVRMVHAT